MGSDTFHSALVGELRRLRSSDGGYPLAAGGLAEVEPTAVAALALRDEAALAWLVRRQREDGGFIEAGGRNSSPSTAALAALALTETEAADRALAFAIDHRSLPLPNAADPKQRSGWGWTADARSLVEPTARVLLGAKALGHPDTQVREEGVTLLRERQCADGGWNFGNASVFDVDLRSYAQTTAFALLALQGEEASMVGAGLIALPRLWRSERGALTIAQSIIAFRLHGVTDEVGPAVEALREIVRRRALPGRALALAWSVLATGPDDGLDRLRSRA